MKHVKTFQLFEAVNRQSVTDEIVNALENTVEGKDILALATISNPQYYLNWLDRYPDDPRAKKKLTKYIPRKTGRVEINNLRGKTYITQLDNGKWYHATEATGRTYGEGIYDTLTECIRGVWKIFIEESISIIPSGMSKKMYKEFLVKAFPDLIGKGFTQDQIREYLKGVYAGDEEMMKSSSPLFSSPRWIQIFNFLGLEKTLNPEDKTGVSYMTISQHYGHDSILELLSATLIPNAVQNKFNVYSSHYKSIRITFYPYKLKLSSTRDGYLSVGDSIEKLKETETIAAKKFIKINLPVGDFKSGVWSFRPILSQEEETLRKLIINFALGIFAMGMEGEDEIEINDQNFYEQIASEIKKMDLSAGVISIIRNKSPKLWDLYMKSTGDEETIDALGTLADLGDLGF